MTTSPVMRLLAEGVPITLLCDLVAIADPQSQTINLTERADLRGHDQFSPRHAVELVAGAKIRGDWWAVSAG
ncbi:MAG TPA: hypothetical protein VFH54_14330 [Mycobacteriales bacterium]|nr:hypothetical protein [Mycobacteriales bacterium]